MRGGEGRRIHLVRGSDKERQECSESQGVLVASYMNTSLSSVDTPKNSHPGCVFDAPRCVFYAPKKVQTTVLYVQRTNATAVYVAHAAGQLTN